MPPGKGQRRFFSLLCAFYILYLSSRLPVVCFCLPKKGSRIKYTSFFHFLSIIFLFHFYHDKWFWFFSLKERCYFPATREPSPCYTLPWYPVCILDNVQGRFHGESWKLRKRLTLREWAARWFSRLMQWPAAVLFWCLPLPGYRNTLFCKNHWATRAS